MQRIHKNMDDYHAGFFKQLQFEQKNMGFYSIYSHPQKPDLGKIYYFEKEGYYKLFISNYTPARTFSLKFSIEERYFQMSNLLKGEGEYQLLGQLLFKLCPTSFLLTGTGRKGSQTWKGGQHYHAAEIVIRERYFKEYLAKAYSPYCIRFEDLPPDLLQNSLSPILLQLLQNLEYNANLGTLTPMLIEGKVLEIISELTKTYSQKIIPKTFSEPSQLIITLPSGKNILLSESDQKALHEAHNILTLEVCTPPTIKELAGRVYLNTQKLKAGFSHLYHMSIHQYVTSLRMSIACNLLSEASLSVADVSKQVGYHNCSKFIAMFQRYYGMTPLKYRNSGVTVINTAKHGS